MTSLFLAAEIYDQADLLSVFLHEHREQLTGSTKLQLIERWKRLREHSDRLERPHTARDLMTAGIELSETEQQLADLSKAMILGSCAHAFNEAVQEPPET